ncbi:MAG: formylglycine-generating enzyme family protein [bacterium]
MIYIPAGDFIMGTDPEEGARFSKNVDAPYLREEPKHKVSIPGYYIDKYEVTNEQYNEFLLATHHSRPVYWKKFDLLKWSRHPVIFISWNDARSYAAWAGKRLPTEAEWEKAARGTRGRIFPWGDSWFKKKLTGIGEYYPIDQISSFDVSPFGVRGMAANVSEWTADIFAPFKGSAYRDENYNKGMRVIKGGSYDNPGHYNTAFFYRSANRKAGIPENPYMDVGFRCALDAD